VTAPTTPAHVLRAWEDALALWGVAIDLSPPVAWKPPAGQAPQPSDPLAYIDLNARQIVVHYERLEELRAGHALTAVFAHEIGHHIRFPHTLSLGAELEILQAKLLPRSPPLTNLFFDLLVNEVVGQRYADDLQAVYRGAVRQEQGDISPLFTFYLALYEELWGLDAGTLTPAKASRQLDESQPVWRSEARVFVQTFWALPTIYLQFLYFCSQIAPYLPHDGTDPTRRVPLSGDLPSPSADDYADALRPSAALQRALRRAKAEGWIDERAYEKAGHSDELAPIATIGSGAPGTEPQAFRRRIVARHYQHLVHQHLFDVPPRPKQEAPEPTIPGTTEPWEWGDSPTTIDWLSSVRATGALAAATPLRRTLWADDTPERGTWIPAIEIYLDTSGSMPDPQVQVNPMTLAAQILAAAALRKGGRVRAIIYSWGEPLTSDWMYDEAFARDFLLNYSGGGTDFPFEKAAEFATHEREAIRVVLSDSDFLHNLQPPEARKRWAHTLDHSSRAVAMLQLSAQASLGPVEGFLVHPRFRLVRVAGMGDFARTATELAHALFGD
jgi:hypothetical protein